jgi:SPP1 gp7 family putative phage head morphogenesis protein
VRVIRTVILEQLHAPPHHDAVRADNVFGLGSLGPRIRLAVQAAVPLPPSSLATIAKQVDAAVTAAVVADLSSQLPGVDLGAVVVAGQGATTGERATWATTTAGRIVEAEGGLVDRALRAAQEAEAAGEDPVAAARDALDSAEVRAALLARDATGNLVAEVTQTRAQQLGADRYIWRSMEDARVRPLHAELDGTTRSWSEPHPTEGHPGDAFGCRCTAQALARSTP